MKVLSIGGIGLGSIFGQPLLVGIVAALLCGLGLGILEDSSHRKSGEFGISKTQPSVLKRLVWGDKQSLLYCALSAATMTVLVLALTKSPIITAPFSVFATLITWGYLRNRKRREAAVMLQVWPEVTDHLISAIHSGLSLSEALAGLGTRGPELLRPYFLLFRSELLESGDFLHTTEKLKARLNSHGSDQILEAIFLAKSLGGSELLQIFRTLGDFLRQDLALRKEIEIKHGWIKNSAHLSSAAPWLLLLLLSSQPGTAEAFAQPGGIAILLTGVFLTSVAYLWMGRLSRLPEPPRVFG